MSGAVAPVEVSRGAEVTATDVTAAASGGAHTLWPRSVKSGWCSSRAFTPVASVTMASSASSWNVASRPWTARDSG